MTVHEIKRFLENQYEMEVLTHLIGTVIDSVMEVSSSGTTCPWSDVSDSVFVCLRVKIRDEGSVKNEALYLALSIQRDGTKEVLGLWIQQSEGAKFWLAGKNELNHCELKDI